MPARLTQVGEADVHGFVHEDAAQVVGVDLEVGR